MTTTKPARSALILGGSGSIGQAIAASMAADSPRLFLSYRTPSAAFDQLVTNLMATGAEVTPIQVDLSNPESGEYLRDQMDVSALDSLVYASGPRVRMTYLSQISPNEVRDQFKADTFAFYNAVHPLLPLLREAKGSVLAITSTAVTRYAKQDVLSVAPKAAIQAFVRAIASEEGPFGVRANCIGVGVIDSGLWHDLVAQGAYSEAFLNAAKSSISLRRFGTAQDVAAASRFLLSEQASWITGQTLNVDGGYAL